MKILIINDNYLGYGSILRNALTKIGYTCELFEFDERGLINKILSAQNSKKITDLTMSHITRNNYTHVILMLGKNHWNTEALNNLSTNIYLYLYDDLSKYSDTSFLRHCNKLFTFNKKDAHQLQNNGYDATFLPLFYDDQTYHRVSIQKKTDIVFIGSTAGKNYKLRREILRKLIFYKNISSEIYNGTDGLSIKLLRSFFDLQLSIKQLKPISLNHQQICNIYHKSKFILNINADNQSSSVPMRIYEALASNGQVINIYKKGEHLDRSLYPKSVTHLTVEAFFMQLNSLSFSFVDLDSSDIKCHSSTRRAEELAKLLCDEKD